MEGWRWVGWREKGIDLSFELRRNANDIRMFGLWESWDDDDDGNFSPKKKDNFSNSHSVHTIMISMYGVWVHIKTPETSKTLPRLTAPPTPPSARFGSCMAALTKPFALNPLMGLFLSLHQPPVHCVLG